MQVRLIIKGPGSAGSWDPLNQKSSIGIKFMHNGQMFGVVLGTRTLARLGVSVAEGALHSIPIELDLLLEGVPPEEI